MSEFEKKTLCYAFLWTWFLILFPPQFFFGPFGLISFHSLGVVGGLLVIFVLNSFFGLWGVFGNGGPYYQENNLTEREKFLSYKATNRTLIVFVLASVICYGCFVTMADKTVDSRYIEVTYLTTIVVFLAVKSYVLFAFLRGERIRNAKTGEITQRQS